VAGILADKINRDRQQVKLIFLARIYCEKEQEQDARRNLDFLVSEKVEAWAGTKKGNIRALLANLHQVNNIFLRYIKC
jgi:hypothetical protein